MTEWQTAARAGLALCKACHCLQPCAVGQRVRCVRCGAQVVQRIPHSLARTWFFLALALLLLLPANLLPMMTIIQFGRDDPSTIISGIGKLYHEGFWAIATIVFVASVVVPLGKIASLIVLLLSVQYRWPLNTLHRARLYRVVEFIGRWSMLDIFVMGFMVGLVRLGHVLVIEPGLGSISFGAVVIITMLAASSFDPRLIWDASEAATQEESASD